MYVEVGYGVCVCVEGGVEEKNPLLSYMHMAVHQLIAERGGKREKASLQSSLWSPRVPV